MTTTTKAKTLQPLKRQRTAEEKKALEKSDEETNYNNQVLNDVWAGKKGRAALMYEDEGGELKRVGWPTGFNKEAYEKSVKAHTKLFSRRPDNPNIPPAEKRGRPNGATTRGSDSFPKDAKIKLLVENPKRPGSSSFEVWKLYEDGMTVDQYFQRGGKVASLKWDSEHDFIKIG